MDLNRSQVLGLNLDMHIVLDAGAGTGKTATMVQRVLEHYLSEDQRATRLLPPGPRDIDLSGGLLVSPSAKREDLRRWGGLLPTEVVVLTFTVKAADEIKERLRKDLARLRPGPRGVRDGLRYDPRIRFEGLVEQLTTLLDDAPIGTIDSFLNRLVSTNRAILGERPTHEQVTDAQRALVSDNALAAIWRVRDAGQAADLGVVSVNAESFVEARDRITHQFGGRARTQKVLSSLMINSQFVDAVRRQLAQPDGIVTPSNLREALIMHLDIDEVRAFLGQLLEIVDDWLEAARIRPVDIGMAAGLGDSTRVACIDAMVQAGVPDDIWDCLIAIRRTCVAIASLSSLSKLVPSPFPSQLLPRGDGWPPGVTKFGDVSDKSARSEMKEAMTDCQLRAKSLLSSLLGLRMRNCSEVAELLDTDSAPPYCPNTSNVYLHRLTDPIPVSAQPNGTVLSPEVDARILTDLIMLQRGASDVLREMKVVEGRHDHSDVADLAEDLLLTRCPRQCRRWYPQTVVLALDSLDETRPWRDDHLTLALQALSESESDNKSEIQEDLVRRISTLKTLRRRYRAFIIDEAQDNSNQQWRLLARLWGDRESKEGDPDPPDSPWQPTVCWVGDQKQSIYAFRQAQVSGFSRYTEYLRAVNQHEYASEERLHRKPALRRRSAGRDPRLVDMTNFVSGLEYVNHRLIPEEAWVEFDRDDSGSRLEHEAVVRRCQGHIDLVTNYRTCGDLLVTMNTWWEDVFSDRHDLFPGDWYPTAKPLAAYRTDDNGALEWLLPASPTQSRDPSSDLRVHVDPFERGGEAKQIELENVLVAARVRGLLDGNGISIDAEAEPVEPVEPKDVMVLMPSRTHMADLVERLNSLGVPALADQEGGLFEQPVVQALFHLLRLAARRNDKSRAANLARTAMVGFDDAKLEEYLSPRGQTDFLAHLEGHAVSDVQANLFTRWRQLADSNRLSRMLDEALDHSDLLLTYPGFNQRQYAEQFIQLVKAEASHCGGDPVLLADHLTRLSSVDGKLLPGEAMPPTNAVRVMTIHGSKGLQAKVVVVTGLFSENQSNLGQSYRSNVLVTGEALSARAKPWKSRESLGSGSWVMSDQILLAQVQAEARRLFYVACTRTKDRLILAGAPPKAILDSETGDIEIDWADNPKPRFGWMWLEAIRQAASSLPGTPSNWILDGDEDNPLPLPKSYSGTLHISPSLLASQPTLAPLSLPSISVLTHPRQALPDRHPRSPLVEMQSLHESILLPPIPLSDEPPKPVHAPRRRLAPHRLDAASKCLRRHVLTTRIGLSGEAIRLPMSSIFDRDENEEKEADMLDTDQWNDATPTPQMLGVLFHRLVELGLANPGCKGEPSAPMPPHWMTKTDSMLQDRELMEVVCNELLPPEVDRETTIAMLEEMADRLVEGSFGLMLSGEVVDGLKVEGLRTEWPFLVHKSVNLSTTPSIVWSPKGPKTVATNEGFTFEFDGVADLVLCQAGEGRSTVRAIDLKTTECYRILNPPRDAGGSLYERVVDMGCETIRTEAEDRLLSHYEMQLYLYHLTLVRQEIAREQAGIPAREVLPPAILSVATGRLISWTQDELDEVGTRFEELLLDLAKVELSSTLSEEDYPRLTEDDREVCEGCPLHYGDIRLCGPVGDSLGVGKNETDGSITPL